jgi:hypothetical protein
MPAAFSDLANEHPSVKPLSPRESRDVAIRMHGVLAISRVELLAK